MVAVQVQVADLHRPATGQGRMAALDAGNLRCDVADLGTGKQVKEVVEGEGDPVGQRKLEPSGPTQREADHPEILEILSVPGTVILPHMRKENKSVPLF